MSKQTDLINIPDAITVSGSNVGIGESSPLGKLHIKGSDTGATASAQGNSLVLEDLENGLSILSSTAGAGYINFGDSGDNNIGMIVYDHSANALKTHVNGSERMRIDSSGNLLVGQTSANATNVGFSVRHQGTVVNTVSGADALELRRHSSAGSIVNFRYGNSTIGSIGTNGGSSRLFIAGAVTGLYFGGGDILPTNSSGTPNDNAVDLGSSGVRFDDIYATNGTIQTSDFNEKQDIASLTATEMLVGKRISALFKTFRWKDSVAENGDNARTHTGVIAQDVQAAFTAEGLDAGDYALFISTTWWETQTEVPAVEAVAEVLDEDGNVTTEAVEAKDAYTRTDTYDTEAEAPEGATSKTRLGIRYPELLSFVAAYNEQRFASIEARLTALEA